MELRQLAELLHRHTRLILATAVLVTLATAATTLLLPPIYNSSALVLFDPNRTNLMQPGNSSTSSSGDSAHVDSEVEILRSDQILGLVSGNENLAEDGEFAADRSLRAIFARYLPFIPTPPSSETDVEMRALDMLKKRVSINRRGTTFVIAISVRSKDPARAAQLANAIAQTYVERQLEQKISASMAGRDKIESQLSEARASVIRAETSFRNYLFDNVDAIVAATGDSEIAALRAQLESVTTRSEVTLSRIERIGAHLARSDWSGLAKSLESAEIPELERMRSELLQALGGTDIGRPASPVLHERLSNLETSLAQIANDEIFGLRSELAATNKEVAALRGAMGSAMLHSNLPPHILTPFYGLQQAAQIATSSYEAMLSRLQALETEASTQLADSRIVSAAIPPISPIFPNKPLMLALGAVGGLGLGIALAFLFENYIGGFTSEQQMQAVLRRKVAATVPRSAVTYGSISDAIIDAPLSRYAEAVRRIRAILDTALRKGGHANETGRGRVIVISSALAEEGKTTLALSLTRTYAVTGRRVLIVDCNMRGPRLSHHLNVDASTGLIDILIRNDPHRDITSLLVRDPMSPALSIVGARSADLPTDQLVASDAFGHIISSARRNFDYVILDAPSLNSAVDGLYLAQHADAVIFVIRWAKTAQHVAASALERMSELLPHGVAVLLALNNPQSTKSG